MDTMLGHRVLLHGLATPGWSEQSGRVVGKREKDGRILVLLDDGREVIHVHRPSVLVQQERVKERAVERREREQLSERERASTREREARGREGDTLRARPYTKRATYCERGLTPRESLLHTHRRQAFVKHNNISLVQQSGAGPALLDSQQAESEGDNGGAGPATKPGTRRTSATSNRWQTGGGGTLSRPSVPGHGRLLFEERAGGSMIPGNASDSRPLSPFHQVSFDTRPHDLSPRTAGPCCALPDADGAGPTGPAAQSVATRSCPKDDRGSLDKVHCGRQGECCQRLAVESSKCPNPMFSPPPFVSGRGCSVFRRR